MKPRPYVCGDHVGSWTLIAFAGRNDRKQRLWHCRCVCGTERTIQEAKLRSCGSYSCGCQPHRARVLNY